MSELNFDFSRAKFLLGDLEEMARGHAPMTELWSEHEQALPIRGMANRCGAFRMGVRIARAALEVKNVVSVQRDGWISSEAGGTLDIYLSDDNFTKRELPRSWIWNAAGYTLVFLVLATIAGLSAIGLGTLINLIDFKLFR